MYGHSSSIMCATINREEIQNIYFNITHYIKYPINLSILAIECPHVLFIFKMKEIDFSVQLL